MYISSYLQLLEEYTTTSFVYSFQIVQILHL